MQKCVLSGEIIQENTSWCWKTTNMINILYMETALIALGTTKFLRELMEL